MRILRRTWGLCILFAVAIAAPDAARAQSSPPFDSAIDVQTFEYAVGPKTFVTVADGDVVAPHQLAVDALFTFSTNPLQVYNVDSSSHMVTGTRTTVIRSISSAQLTAAYGLSDRLQLGLNLPIVFALQGDGLMPQTGSPSAGGLNVTGLGDLVVEGKLLLARRGLLRTSAIAGLSLPSSVGSGGSQFIGDDLPTVRGKLAAQIDAGRLSFGANIGVLLRKPRTIYDNTVGQQLVWGAAAAAQITERLSVIAEGYGRAGLPGFALDASPLEAEGGLRIRVAGDVTVLIGGGAGLIKGIGSPQARVFVSLGYAPDTRDSDGDGIPNGRDKCPLVPEDKDGFQDDDGCPDDDNDGDHRPDAVDKCPNEAEDIDGFEDDDGCPDPDNDKDGIPDLQDKCPNEPEDGKPPFPKDGCPASKASAAPTEPAAADPAPHASKPDPELQLDEPTRPAAEVCVSDRDHDGIPDADDKCPDEPETVNGVDDDDGCPDAGGLQVIHLDGDRLTLDRVPTVDAHGLTRGGAIIVDQLALVMRGHSDVTKWLIAVAMPSTKAAQQVAAAIQARLVARGVPAGHIAVVSAAGPARAGGVAQERAPDAACAPPRRK
jgi:hypothetical protein